MVLSRDELNMLEYWGVDEDNAKWINYGELMAASNEDFDELADKYKLIFLSNDLENSDARVFLVEREEKVV